MTHPRVGGYRYPHRLMHTGNVSSLSVLARAPEGKSTGIQAGCTQGSVYHGT